MEQNNNDTIEIDLREIFALLLHWGWLLFLVAVITGLTAFAVSRFVITPTYESTTRIVILNRQSDNSTLTYSDLQMGTQLTKDYAELIRSRYVAEQVLETFELDLGYEAFIKKIHVNTPADTRIIDITVTDPDPLLAKGLVDEIRTVAAARIEEVMDIEAVNVVDTGNLPGSPSNPNILKWTLIGFLLGAFVAGTVVIVRFLLDDTIKSSEDIEKYLGLSTLALIPVSMTPDEEKSGKKHKVHSAHNKGGEKEDEEEQGEIQITDLEELE